jgi:hypothetical protein
MHELARGLVKENDGIHLNFPFLLSKVTGGLNPADPFSKSYSKQMNEITTFYRMRKTYPQTIPNEKCCF